MTDRTALRFATNRTLFVIACSLALAACSGDDDAGTPMTGSDTSGGGSQLEPADDVTGFAFVSGSLAQTGQIERLALGDAITSTGTGPATTSDILVATDGSDVYEIGRFQLDRLSRFAADDLTTPLWQYSVNGSETLSNPYEIVFASPTKAYVIRYGSPLVWIVDPSATSEAGFFTGNTIDLSAYDNDGIPEASDAVIVEDRLYILMQRLTDFAPSQSGYVAVIDIATDTEVQTGQGQDGLPGIELLTRNPGSIDYLPASDELFVTSVGNAFFSFNDVAGDPWSGGIETIDSDSFANDVLVDDGSMDDNAGFFLRSLVVSPSKGYVVTSVDPDGDGLGETMLRSFDPRTGLLDEGMVQSVAGLDIAVLAIDLDGRLWVGYNDMDAPGFRLLDPADDSVLVERVPTQFNPNDIVFVQAPVADDAS